MQLTLNSKQTIALVKAVGADRTIIVRGHHGIGKTSMLYALAEDPDFAGYHIVNPMDCTQMSDGSVYVPDIDRELCVSREYPNERFGINAGNHRDIDGSQPIILCFDEVGKAKQGIKDMIAPIIYEHRLGERRMPLGSIVFCLTNISAEGLGDSVQGHLRDRLIDVTLRNPTAQEWIEDFAIPRGLHAAVIACCDEYPQVFESFMDYEPGAAKSGQDLARTNPYIYNPRAVQDKWATPRSLHAASDILNKGGSLDEHTLTVALNGTIGRAFTTLLMAYVRFGRSLPQFGAICHDPQGTFIPDNAGARVMLAFQLITKTQDSGAAEAVSQYMNRMPGEARLLFTKNVSNNSKKMGVFARSATFTQTLTQSLRVLNAR
jgi:hypothetical protein